MKTKLTISHLRSALATSPIEVDEKAGIIKGCAIMTIGPATGHGFTLDAKSLQQAHAILMGKTTPIKARFKHPAMLDDGSMSDVLGTDVATIQNPRIDGNTLRGDVHLASWSGNMPMMGDARSYLMGKAKDDPTGMGLSAVIAWTPETLTEGDVTTTLARIEDVQAVDFVGKPAANPNGLLAAVDPEEQPPDIEYDDNMMRVLRDFGLPWDFSEEAAEAFFDALDDFDKQRIRSRMRAIAAAHVVDAEEAADSAKQAAAKVGATASKMSAGEISDRILTNLKAR